MSTVLSLVKSSPNGEVIEVLETGLAAAHANAMHGLAGIALGLEGDVRLVNVGSCAIDPMTTIKSLYRLIDEIRASIYH